MAHIDSSIGREVTEVTTAKGVSRRVVGSPSGQGRVTSY